MGLFDKIKEPVFLKESSNAENQLEKLKGLEPLLNNEGKAKLRQEIKCVEYGIAGEKNIAFELKNSHIPMYILHDIYLESGDLSAQIDYLVFTKKLCFVIECKNLVGNIEINNTGDFIRTMEFGGKKKKEGIYSPITQNERHLELMKKIKADNKTNIIMKFMVGKYFEKFNKPIVVLANSKTVLNAKYAKKEVKNQVIKADQLVNYIKESCEKCKESKFSDSEMLAWAQSYFNLHIDSGKDYISKFDKYLIENDNNEMIKVDIKEEHDDIIKAELISENIEELEIFKELKAFRLNKSREENIKPYFIYNNNQLMDLISKKPATTERLKDVDGFGDVKVKKYGEDIIQIVSRYV